MKKLLIPAITISLLCCAVSAQADWSDFATKTESRTKNPIVLIPGIFAFDSIAGVDYWYKIPAALESQGATVFIPKINAFDSSAKRGERLIEQLENIRAASDGKIQKFNLMGHSQGGVTARYVMGVRPDLVASVTSLHTPHKGSPLADVMTGVAEPGTLQGISFEVFANAVGNLVNLMSDNKQDKADVTAMLAEFNASGSAEFNKLFPVGVPTDECGEGPASATVNGHDIQMYSWSGISTVTSGLDISDALFAMTSSAFDEPNDGITGQCSSHFGKVVKDDYRMNHIDANNHVLGLVSLFETKPVTLFQNHAKRLQNAGL